jgi:hypothetical protein
VTLGEVFLPIFRFAPVTSLSFFQNKLNITHIRRTSRKILETCKQINAISKTGNIGQENVSPLNFSLQSVKGGVRSSCCVALHCLIQRENILLIGYSWWQEL